MRAPPAVLPAVFPAVLLAASLALAGCAVDSAEPRFDGDGAHDLVRGLVTHDDGTSRYRIPGTDGQASGAAWLWSHLDDAALGPSWTSGWHNVTGSDYQNRSAPSVDAYRAPGACPEDDRAAVPGLVFHNLWARYDHPATDDTLLLAAHWDSKEDAEGGGPLLGANDGASGVGVLLRLVQHVEDGDLAPPVDLVVAFFDGEDGFEDCHPLAGSIAFAQDEPAGAIDRMILLDMVGDLDARFVREARSMDSDPELVDLLWKHGRAHGGTAQFTNRERPVLDDHVPFLEAGVRAVDLIDFGRTDTPYGFPPYWHTTGDTMDHVDAEMLALVGDTLWSVLQDPELLATW